MSKEDVMLLEGFVEELLPNAMFRVRVENMEKLVLGHLSGKMRKNNIKVLAGDEVDIEFSPYNLSRGRIVVAGKYSYGHLRYLPTDSRSNHTSSKARNHTFALWY